MLDDFASALNLFTLMVPNTHTHSLDVQKHVSCSNTAIHQRLAIIVFNVSTSSDGKCSVIGIDCFCMSASDTDGV